MQTQHGQLGLVRWSIYINEGRWIPRDFDVIVIELLQYALAGKVSKLLFSLPRRHGKSTLISKNFISYFLAHYPDDSVILSSYTQLLASGFGKDCKNILRQYGHLSPYNVELAEDSKANNKFNLKHPYTGQMLAVGQAGSIIGFGAGLFVIDDPIKSSIEAKSETIQENLKEWIMGTAKTSLETRRNGLPPIMAIIAQRLNIYDLHGIIKENEPTISGKEALDILRDGGEIPPEVWVDVNFPAICEDPENDLLSRKIGEVLWPKQRSYKWLMAEKKAMGDYLFNAIYQGNPKEREGKFFKPENFEIVDYLPNDIIQEIQWSDLAATYYPPETPIHQRGAATATIRLALTKDRRLFITFINEFWAEEDVVADNIIQIAKIRGNKSNMLGGNAPKFCIPQDPGQAGKGQVKKYSLLLPGYNFEGIIETGDKEDRAEAPSTWAKINKIYIYKEAADPELIKRFIRVVSDFPNNKHKDFVDALSGAFSMLDIPDEYVDYALPESVSF